MNTTLGQLRHLLTQSENEHLEFKSARNNFEAENLFKYCVALSNEGGGKLILGVTDKRPRDIVGTGAFDQIERTKQGIAERLNIRVDVDEIEVDQKRILVFEIPPRPLGMPIQYKGAYWMRAGESLVPMTPDMLRRILDETGPDYSVEICPSANVSHLESSAIEEFREMWVRKSGNVNLRSFTHHQLLVDAELIIDDQLTYAALILFGSRSALGKLLPQAEVIFEYRSSEASGPAQKRVEFREGLFLFQGKLLNEINLRNDTQHFQEGLFVWDIPTFNETVIRESLLNAVCHRDYRLSGSVFVRQYPRKLVIESPGGLPTGVNLDNILWRQSPRNRRIAESLSKCGLVERSGQGVNLMFEESIKEGKSIPDFSGTDDHLVKLTLQGEIRDKRFLQFLEKIGKEKQTSFTTDDFLVLDLIHREVKIPGNLKGRLPLLFDQGVIEKAGRGKILLSRKFYKFIGKKGSYTRKIGLDRRTNKQLLLKHIEDNTNEGSPLRDLMQVLPSLTKSQVQSLLRELKSENKIKVEGHTRAGKWYPA